MKYKLSKIILTTIMMCMAATVLTFAGDIGSSQLVEGTKKLITDITAVFTGIAGGITGMLAIKNAIAWNIADDQEKPRAKKRLFTDLGIGVIATVAVALVGVILSYYGG